MIEFLFDDFRGIRHLQLESIEAVPYDTYAEYFQYGYLNDDPFLMRESEQEVYGPYLVSMLTVLNSTTVKLELINYGPSEDS